jgi:cytoskeletal protein RodZ
VLFGEKTTSTFGEHLRREREMRGVSLDEISSATRISTRFLLALEREQWNQLPGGVFNRGFIRSVARYLGLDEEGLLAEYALVTKDKPQIAPVADSPAQTRHRPWPWVLLLIVILLGAGGWLAWQQFAPMIHAYRNPPEPPKVAQPALPEEVRAIPGSGAGGASLAAEPEKLALKLDVGQATTVKVTADGRLVFNDLMRPGQSRTFEATTGFEISAANARTVVLEMNGQVMPPIGPDDTAGSIKLSRSDLKKAEGGRH